MNSERSDTDQVTVQSVEDEPELEIIRELVREYAEGLGEDSWLCAVDLEEQLSRLPGVYAEPEGCILLAESDNEPAGCVLMEPADETTAELQRLYVKPAFRRKGIGRRLTEEVLDRARARGYDRLRLVTTRDMTEAQKLYRSLGFKKTDPFHDYGDHFIYMIRDL